MKDLFWIGIQESEIENTYNLFEGSITIFGSNSNNNFAFEKKYNKRYDYNQDSELWNEFVNSTVKYILKKYPNAQFLLYYPMDISYYNQELKSRIIGLNDVIYLDILDNKIKCKNWFGNEVPTICSEVYFGKTLIEKILEKKCFEQAMVVQGEYSCGGSNTWILNEKNKKNIINRIDSQLTYSISPYYENSMSLNIHVIVYANEIIILPASIQIININNDSFEYQGADFILYQTLPSSVKKKVYDFANLIGHRLCKSGYRGICGIDFLETNGEVYFLELNPRFQSSSFIINMAYNKINTNFSLQHLHLDSFINNNCSYKIPKTKINYSFYKMIYNSNRHNSLKNLSHQAKKSNQVIYIDDKLSWDSDLENNTYLFKLIFTKNICSISPYKKLQIHPNLLYESPKFNSKNLMNHLLELKIMLLSHGVFISSKVINYLEKNGGINCQEFDAIDISILDKCFISVPYEVNLSFLSPFNIRQVNGKLYLYYNYSKLIQIKIRGIDLLSKKETDDGFTYSEIAYLGNDRLRISHRVGCYFKDKGCGCGFCDLVDDKRKLSINTIKTVINAYDENKSINHYLIGGGSQSLEDDFSTISEISKYLKNRKGKPIYLMSLPPMNTTILEDLKNAGITEVAFNIEIYNRIIARKYMPGKGKIPLKAYFNALKNAVKLWGKNGKVRTIFIVGLEPVESLLKGIEEVCKIGVSPILSLFKPVENTPLSHLMPPSDTEILDIVLATEKICEKYNLSMGPECHYCEDNTLKLTR